MAITPTRGMQSGAPEVPEPSKLGKDEFVKLLMAQLGHQDPLSPMDSQAFVSQLAQFANIELQQSSNSRLEALLVAQAASNQISAAGLVGKDVVHLSDKVTLRDGEPAVLGGSLKGAATAVTAVITDATGKVVRTLKSGGHDKGDMTLTWDGLSDSGNRLPPGDYAVQLTAADIDGKNVPIEQRARSRIQGVSFENGYPELVLASSTRLKLSDVVEIDEAP
ncbi:MAG: flagellar hook assembly protein FlgD [Myxococcaceae bacterium]|nr:flagellar hook assembly protein FlgD [Myxococcaceae bacterium]